MSKSSKAREKFEKISQSKSNAYLSGNSKSKFSLDEYMLTMYPKKPKVKIKSKANSNNNIEDKFRKDLVSKATKSELVFRKFLNDNMIAHEFQKIIHVSVDCKQKFYIADFYFKRYNIIVELDGGYHYTDGQKIKDDLRSMHLRRAGYFVLRFDNSRTEDCKSIYSEILAFIKEKFGDI